MGCNSTKSIWPLTIIRDQIAREAECDEDEAAFMEKLGQIARHKPKDDPPDKDRGP
jgi:hypothetical protein